MATKQRSILKLMNAGFINNFFICLLSCLTRFSHVSGQTRATVGPPQGPTVGPPLGPTVGPPQVPTVGPPMGPTLGPPVGPPLCGSDIYDVEILKRATAWRAPIPGGCYDSFGNKSAPCDFYFSFCKDLPTTLTGGRPSIGASQNATKETALAMGGRSYLLDDEGGQLLLIAWSGGDTVGCGPLSGIMMYLHCDKDAIWGLNADGSGEIHYTYIMDDVKLYNTSGACSYRIDIKYDGACYEFVSKQGLSAGSILIIIFLCTVAVYLLGGVVMNFAGGATGLELLPNIEFWKSLPGLIAEGAIFFWSCLWCQDNGSGIGANKSGYDSI